MSENKQYENEYKVQALLPALCTHFHLVYCLTFLFPPFLSFPILFL